MASGFSGRLGTAPEEGIKAPCVVAATSNITLSGEQTIDSTSVVAGDRVLVAGQTDNTENGIYDAKAGAWSRSTDWNSSDDVISSQLVMVPTLLYEASFSGTYTPGTTALTFAAVAGGAAASTILAGIIEIATDTEARAMTVTNRAVTPGNVGSMRATAAEMRALTRTDRLVTPALVAQTFYAIRLFLGGTPTVQTTTPQTSSWTIARGSTGVYTLTHSLDLTDQDGICWNITEQASGGNGACINATKDTLTIQTVNSAAGTFVDSEVDWMLFGFRFKE